MTFSSLVSDISAYAERSDSSFMNQIPRFIMLAENRLASEVHGLGYLKFVNGTLSPSDPVLEKPAFWRETESFSIVANNQRVFLLNRSYAYCREYWPDESQTATPKFYCDYGYEHFLVAATPDEAYSFEIAYHQRPAPLDASNQTNWTTQYAPQLILYGTLLEAQPWLKLDDRIGVFQALYDRAVAAVTNESSRRLNGDEALARKVG